MPDVISVRQTRSLPPASFRFRLAVDTLAFGYVLLALSTRLGLASVRLRAHIKGLLDIIQEPFVKINSGDGLLSQGKNPSTIGAGELNYRVRDGNGCILSAMVTGKLV